MYAPEIASENDGIRLGQTGISREISVSSVLSARSRDHTRPRATGQLIIDPFSKSSPIRASHEADRRAPPQGDSSAKKHDRVCYRPVVGDGSLQWDIRQVTLLTTHLEAFVLLSIHAFW